MAAQTPLKNPQPKHRFQESLQNISAHRDMVDRHEFQRGMDFGMLQYVAFMAGTITSDDDAKAVGWKIKGAHEFLLTVRNISENPAPANVTPLAPNLDHKLS